MLLDPFNKIINNTSISHCEPKIIIIGQTQTHISHETYGYCFNFNMNLPYLVLLIYLFVVQCHLKSQNMRPVQNEPWWFLSIHVFCHYHTSCYCILIGNGNTICMWQFGIVHWVLRVSQQWTQTKACSHIAFYY